MNTPMTDKLKAEIREIAAKNKIRLHVVEAIEGTLAGIPEAQDFTIENLPLLGSSMYLNIATNLEEGKDAGELMDRVLKAIKNPPVYPEGCPPIWTCGEFRRSFVANSYLAESKVDGAVEIQLNITPKILELRGRRFYPNTVYLKFTQLGEPPACEVRVELVRQNSSHESYKRTVICTDPVTGEQQEMPVGYAF